MSSIYIGCKAAAFKSSPPLPPRFCNRYCITDLRYLKCGRKRKVEIGMRLVRVCSRFFDLLSHELGEVQYSQNISLVTDSILLSFLPLHSRQDRPVCHAAASRSRSYRDRNPYPDLCLFCLATSLGGRCAIVVVNSTR